uniref:Reverse transcriptase domain-containing protein n=1 Tax=Tanacetum cinerariifolium TaxID=118510 RepID=A0A6L2N835_TANCI|nr:hypothetical protein [Tanacetum cinerariifolium]
MFQRECLGCRQLEYDKSTSKDHPIILSDDDEGHSVQDKESLENPSNEIAVSKPGNESKKEPEATTDTELSSPEDIHPLTVQEPPQDFDIRRLIREECFVEVSEEQKQKIENTMIEFVEICRHKEILCMYDNVDDLIESTLDTKLLSINSKSQHSIRRSRKSGTLKRSRLNESHPFYQLKNLSIHSVWDDSSPAFTTFSNPLFDNNDDLDSNDNESLPDEDVPAEEFKVYSNPFFDEDEINSDKLEPHCFNGESDFVESLLNRATFIDSSSIFDFLLNEFSGELAHIDPVLPEDNDSREEIDLATDTDKLLPLLFENDDEEEIEASDNPSFLHPLLESPNAEADQESMNDIYDNDPFMKEVDLFLATYHSIPPCNENYYDTEGDIRFLETLLIDDSIPFSVNESFEDDPSIPRPPTEPPDDEFEFDPKTGDVISAVIDNIDKPNKDKSFDLGGEIIISTKDEDVDYFPFMFVIQIFLPYLILPEISPLFLSAESEDTIFDPGISI